MISVTESVWDVEEDIVLGNVWDKLSLLACGGVTGKCVCVNRSCSVVRKGRVDKHRLK